MSPERQEQYHQYFMSVARETAKLSHAKRTKVGAVLVLDNRIISQGHNGTPTHYNDACEDVLPDGSLVTKKEVIHAEANAIYFCARNGISTNGTILYLTMSPCVNCALAIIQAGIRKVYYLSDYRDLSGVKFLRENNIEVIKLNEENT